MVFGENYYFTSCSTKAANQTCMNAWKFGSKPDTGQLEPKDGSVGYILFCIVGTGKSMITTTRNKHPTFKPFDSLIYKGVYEPTQYESWVSRSYNVLNELLWFRLNFEGIEARIPKLPFRRMIGFKYASDVEAFYFDEICVNTPDKVLPVVLAEVMFNYDADDLCWAHVVISLIALANIAFNNINLWFGQFWNWLSCTLWRSFELNKMCLTCEES